MLALTDEYHAPLEGSMSFLADLRTADWAIVFATLVGPILAVQAQKWIEGLRERRNRKHSVFHQLMATRKERLSPDHVKALNMIALAFYGAKYFSFRWQAASEKAVIGKWKEYFDHLNLEITDANEAAMLAQRDNLFVDLLALMADDLGYEFDKVELRRGAYSPQWHGQIEDESNRLRKSLVQVFEGKKALPMFVVNLPVTQQQGPAPKPLPAEPDAPARANAPAA